MNSNCLLIDIIGSVPDENENTNKIDGYCQVSNGILINNLAKYLLMVINIIMILLFTQTTNVIINLA